jgi:nitrate reductase cytochrome c-type subunit
MRLLIFSLLTSLLIASCSNEEQPVSNTQEKIIDQSLAGKSLMENKCYSCHSPKVAKEYILAPPMIEIKEIYTKSYANQEEFINAFQQFLSKPTKDKAIMKEAVKKHGLMPYQGSSDEEVSMIATYIYSNDIEKPNWWKNEGQSSNKELSFGDIGLKYALTTKKALGKTLMTAIEEKGTKGALMFCNTQAMPITDSMSLLYNAKIKRVSDKPRNPNNLANKEELAQIDFFKSELKAQNEIKPITTVVGNNVEFYYPIITNGMCLQCHGTKNEQIKESTLNKLAELYPSDKATGYKENEVRGIWSIVFEKE